jgi:UDP-N-acetylglucosamine:LPS N-acetylglucosamine transferase
VRTNREVAEERADAARTAVTDAGGWPQSALLVASSGGHLAQLLALEPWWSARRRLWVTFATPDAQSQLLREDVVWAHFPTTRNLRNLIRNFLLALRTVRRSRPDVIVSTGAGVALPFFIAARMRGIPTVYVEVYDRIDTRTLTGRLCRPFTTLFCVQWEEQLELYKGAQLIGELL